MRSRGIADVTLAILMGLALATLVLLPQGEAGKPQTDLTWRFTGDLKNARGHHTATLLPDGRVLVAGGLGAEGTNTSAELFDPKTRGWTLTGNLNGAHGFHTATLLNDGRVLVAGGIGAGALPTTSAELFDPKTETWTPTGSLNQGRTIHTATLLPDGRVLVVGGFGTPGTDSSAELFDPETGGWTLTTPLLPNEGRAHHTATLLNDGRVLVAGGEIGLPGNAILRGSAWIFDPEAGSWTPTGDLKVPRSRQTATLLHDGRVLVAGGSGDSTGAAIASAEIFDPAKGSWTLTDPLHDARILYTATLLNDGRVLAVGGLTGTGADDPMLASTELFDPKTEMWNSVRKLNEARANHTATLLNRGQVLVAGGKAAALSPLPEIGSAEIATVKAQFFAYVTNEHTDVNIEHANVVSVIDTRTDTVVDTIPVGDNPIGVVGSPDGAKVYVVNNNDATMSVIDTKSNTVVATIEGLGNGALQVAITPDGTRLYVTNFGEHADVGIPGTTVSVIDTEINAVIATIPGLGPNPTGLAVTPDGKRVYVSNELALTVSVIDTATNTIIGPPIPVGIVPASVTITPDGRRAYVTNLVVGTVSVIDTETNTVIATIKVGEQPLGSAVTPDGRRLYVVNKFSASVSVIDTSTNTVIHTITEGLGRGPSGAAITPDGAKLYVSNNNADDVDPEIPDTVSVIDTQTNTVIATVEVVNQPSGIAIIRGQ
jgi:YVTN family beta-propeller protein